MATIVVGGSGKGVGKTTLICGLIAALPEFRWTAVKITSHDHGQAGRIVEDARQGATPGTDTGRYLAAGAERALLVSALPDEFAETVGKLIREAGPEAHLIFESNRILGYLKPDVCLLLHGCMERASWKPSFNLVARQADAMVERCESDLMLKHSAISRPVFQLAALDRISPQMLDWLRTRLSATVAAHARA
jgi:hypothetical protein